MWNPGDQVLIREIWNGRLWSARPMTVVRDSTALLALYIAPGTRWKKPITPQGEWAHIAVGDWQLADAVWNGPGCLRLATPGEGHSVLLFWRESGGFRNWYVNLERPLERTSRGFDYADLLLDIVVAPDRSTWHLKDEDHLEAALAAGLILPDEAAAVRAEAERVARVIEADGPPFCDGWERWTPDPSWPVPELPDGWDVV